MEREIFFTGDADAADFDSFVRYSYVDDKPPFVVAERIIPNATRSGHAIVRNTSVWEVDEFTEGSAPEVAKIGFKRFMERLNAHRT